VSSTVNTSPTPTGAPDRASGLSARYARALYDLADERKQLDQTVTEMATLGELIKTDAPLQRLVASRSIDAMEAARAMDAVLSSQGFSDLIRHFIGTAIQNRRLRDLPDLISGFAVYVAGKRGIVTAEVASAHPLTDVQRTQLTARLAEAGYGRVTIRESVDPALLGGLTVRIGSKLYDTSLKSRLQRLRFVMKGAA
jgi:F-type H+-transporting ATPase subunit delta